MKTRNQSKGGKESSGTLADLSREAVGKHEKRANSRSSGRIKKQDGLRRCESIGIPEKGSRNNEEQNVGSTECGSKNVARHVPLEKEAERERGEEMDEPDWEDGAIHISDSRDTYSNNLIKEVTVEFNVSPDSNKRKTVRRASAEDKELAELVHKVHLLCLLARGRLIDTACCDPLIQASLLSILPRYLLQISEVPKLSAKALAPLVSWFHENFHIRSTDSEERSFPSALARALETRGGTPEEVAALSVALFRALNLTTRFVSILDVASLKPEAEMSETSGQNAIRTGQGIFNSSTLMVHRPNPVFTSPSKVSPCSDKENISETLPRGGCKRENSDTSGKDNQHSDSHTTDQPKERLSDLLASEVENDISEACPAKEGLKRKGDFEFEMQMEMALSATAVGKFENNTHSDAKGVCNGSLNLLSQKRVKRIRSEEPSTSSQGISTAIGSKKVGPPLYWAEVYCSGENLTGKWVHVDAANAIIDGEQNVEAAAAACRTSLRYVVAFSGHGAKDVTRRYCMKWYKISSHRINSNWWDMVLAPLKELESGATTDHVSLPSGLGVDLYEEDGKKIGAESSVANSFLATRNSLEDLELETRALTEPLPTNQQAYKNHQLYALERWLTKYQILHPKGPVLGFCSGHPVYPRTCVQTLKTKERWLREGLQLKVNELPAKVLKHPVKLRKVEVGEADDDSKGDCGGTVVLYGKWQMEPLCLPCAVNGVVPKNERGQVDVWSEKCLPPGTVHLRLPRVFTVAKRLEIDYAPAMVGFDFRNGRSIPVYDGIVVCAEFMNAILEGKATILLSSL